MTLSKETKIIIDVCIVDKLKGQSHEINVCFFGAQWTGKILLMFSRKGFFHYINYINL